MKRVVIHPLILLFSLSDPAMGEHRGFERSSLAAKTTPELYKSGESATDRTHTHG